MDIVSRLKYFMETQQIAISQFADTCRIPRPTVSQLLNGRNKKVSDEIICKIHTAFPQLSVLWLMFGEGDMTMSQNTPFSEAQNHIKLTFDDANLAEHEIFANTPLNFNNVSKIGTENLSEPFLDKNANTSPLSSPIERQPSLFTNNLNQENTKPEKPVEAQLANIVKEQSEAGKRITSIVVFYADNTFQTFNPTT